MSTYKNAYNEKAVGQIVPIVLVVFLIVLYMMSAQGDRNYAASILIGAAAITMIFWARILKKFIVSQQSKFVAREPETKNWMYDLIKDEGGFVFVAEVPGPVEKITVRLVDGTLYIRGSGGFAREVPITGADRMELSDFKYRNGVLTLRIS
ncbi:MAG: Hsp20/alpha crystallin family protein [Cenarchaeum sp. SB0663_bin_5]|nr:Hsp20/alpha crystallin family protein [Cenarchaeum sp. SB0663_bin_5]MYH04545.1 Hsp20/alpha crystallin family protein [Cenarchaeum sp. SB0675_bin_21]MYL11408.1 Hsp20/alpha crystallin family protein [Cenarchaeum sp. SB0669_bin_11]